MHFWYTVGQSPNLKFKVFMDLLTPKNNRNSELGFYEAEAKSAKIKDPEMWFYDFGRV